MLPQHDRLLITHLLPGTAQSEFSLTSPPTDDYNCIAWAAGDNTRWWWPRRSVSTLAMQPVGGSYWPDGVANDEILDSFVEAFRMLGYEVCESDSVESGFEKVALYVDEKGKPTHAARQLPNGAWTSKLGGYYDIEHAKAADVGGHTAQAYGDVALVLRRPRP